MKLESRLSRAGCYKAITRRVSILSLNAFRLEPKVRSLEEEEDLIMSETDMSTNCPDDGRP